MQTIEDQIESRKAWDVWKKLIELQNLLWEFYCHDFISLEKKQNEREILEAKQPF